MILASPYFKTMLGGPWREADELELEAEDWDRGALLIIMRVIHVQNQHVPRLIKLELLAKIAILVDYYECRDAIDLAAEIWIKQLTPPEEPSKDHVFLAPYIMGVPPHDGAKTRRLIGDVLQISACLETLERDAFLTRHIVAKMLQYELSQLVVQGRIAREVADERRRHVAAREQHPQDLVSQLDGVRRVID